MLIVSPSTFTPWDTVAQLVNEHVVECPIFFAQDHIRRAGREFFTRSGIWRSPEILLLTTVAGTQGYAHTPPANAELVRVYSAWNGEDEVDVAWPGEWSDAPAAVTSASDWHLDARDPNTLWLSPVPDVSGTVLRGTVVYAPTSAGAGIPSHAFDEWGLSIAAGAAAALVIQSNRQWSNPNAHQALRGMFDAAVRSAANQGGRVRRKSLRVTPW